MKSIWAFMDFLKDCYINLLLKKQVLGIPIVKQSSSRQNIKK
ncbi:hypothetical protein EV06_1345 [Prochlorococcus sp. MIT 0602]|nr:hypothetical protein EV06_1345 [Prochlorococcus sp. MIT 0602]KGG17753.1 hypothetical protein EV07_1193 [Prochlorococcus sp. MIT 0603]